MNSSLKKALKLNFAVILAAQILYWVNAKYLAGIIFLVYATFTITMIPVLLVAGLYTHNWKYYGPYLSAEVISLAIAALAIFNNAYFFE